MARLTAVLMQDHNLLRRQFLALEVSLQDGDASAIKETLCTLAPLLEAHIREEEEVLLPAVLSQVEREIEEHEAAPAWDGSWREGRCTVLAGIGRLVEEHRDMHRAIEEMREPAVPDDRVLANAGTLAALTWEHLAREDDFLYPVAEHLLPGHEKRALRACLKAMRVPRVDVSSLRRGEVEAAIP